MADTDTDRGLTSEEIYERFRTYQQMGMLEYVLPTIPLGERWVLGVDGLGICKLMGDGDAIVFIVGMENAIRFFAKQKGVL